MSTTTTTTVPAASSSTSNDAWIWILVAIAVLAAIAFLIWFLVSRSSRRRAVAAWLPLGRSAFNASVVARDLLVGEPPEADESTHREVQVKVEEAAQMLDRATGEAPDDDARLCTRDTAEGLRALLFAIEAERLMRSGDRMPTAVQLAEADRNRRDRETALESAMSRFHQRLETEQPSTSASGTDGSR